MSQQKNIDDHAGPEAKLPTKITDNYRATRNLVSTWCAALIGISLIILQDYISIGITDSAVFISLIAFSLALPLLAGTIFYFGFELQNDYTLLRYRFTEITIITGALSALIGIDAALWHLTWIAGAVFIITLFVVYLGIAMNLPNLKIVQQLKKAEAEKEKALD